MAELTEKELFQRVDLTHSADREKIAAPSLNFLQDSWRRLTKNKGALVSLFIILVIVLLAFLAPVIAPFDPLEQNTEFANLPARIPGLFNGYRNGVDVYAQQGVPEGVNFFFGTDNLGRDLFSRVLYGTQTSLIIAFVAGLLSCFISFMMTVFVVFRTLILGNPTSGWTSLMAVILFLGGIQLLTIGILGKYISKIYLETKKRPLYLVKEKSDLSIFEGKNKRKRL